MTTNKFEELGVSEELVKAVTELGFETPSAIQEKAIPLLLQGNKDLIGLAQTGTGKTAAFGLPLLQLVDFDSKNVQALILCPTRELCLQITGDLKKYSKYMKGVFITAVYGGASIVNQIKDLKRGAQIVVATPGRIMDMIERKAVNLSGVKITILDEADEMLNMGFREDLDKILAYTPDEKNTWLFSATMPNDVLRITKKYMTIPAEITVGTKNQGAENIEHIFYVVHARDRYLALKRIMDYSPDIFGIVFCRTKIETQEVADHLIKDGYNADALHGDLSQAQRDFVMRRYRSRTLQMLVATDVAARGIDVSDVTHVINYNLPDDNESYTHRSGRTARAGKKGVSIAILNTREAFRIREIESMIKKKFTRGTIPTGIQICEKQLFHLVNKIHHIKVNEGDIAAYLPKIMEELQDVSKEDLIKRFVSEEFNRFLNYYKNTPDINVDDRSRGEGRGERSGAGGRSVRMFVNLGQMDKLDHTMLKDYVAQVAGLDKNAVFNADIKSSFSFVDVDESSVDVIKQAFRDEQFNGRRVTIQVASRREGGAGRSEGSRDSGERKPFFKKSYSSGSGGGDRRGSFAERKRGGGGFNRKGR